MSDERRVYLKDCHDCGFCSSGVREFFTVRGWDFLDFVHNGLPVSVFEETGDGYALRVVERVRR